MYLVGINWDVITKGDVITLSEITGINITIDEFTRPAITQHPHASHWHFTIRMDSVFSGDDETTITTHVGGDVIFPKLPYRHNAIPLEY